MDGMEYDGSIQYPTFYSTPIRTEWQRTILLIFSSIPSLRDSNNRMVILFCSISLHFTPLHLVHFPYPNMAEGWDDFLTRVIYSTVIILFQVFMPRNIYLLRGNHESKYCTSVYGFEKEVMVKYGDKGKHVYRKCLGCFEGLPLASIIAGCVYTAHGGLFRCVTVTPSKRLKGKKNRKINVNPDRKNLSLGSLEELSKARRSVLDPPWEGSNLIPGDVLWSDPSKNPGLAPNKERGIGLLWGPDCTEEFLKKYQLKVINKLLLNLISWQCV